LKISGREGEERDGRSWALKEFNYWIMVIMLVNLLIINPVLKIFEQINCLVIPLLEEKWGVFN